MRKLVQAPSHLSHDLNLLATSFERSLFYIVGLCGYLYAYEDTKDNILLNFPLAYLDILVGRVGYGVTIMLGFPMVFLPCRSSILSLPSQIKAIHSKNRSSSKLAPDEETPLVASSSEKRGTDLGGDEASGQGTFASTGAESHEDDASVFPDGNEDAWVHVLSTMGILLICYIMAVAGTGCWNSVEHCRVLHGTHDWIFDSVHLLLEDSHAQEYQPAFTLGILAYRLFHCSKYCMHRKDTPRSSAVIAQWST